MVSTVIYYIIILVCILTEVVLTCFVMCGCVYVGVCFDICVGVLVVCVLVFTVFRIVCTVFFVLFRLCIFILICFVSISVRTTATE